MIPSSKTLAASSGLATHERQEIFECGSRAYADRVVLRADLPIGEIRTRMIFDSGKSR